MTSPSVFYLLIILSYSRPFLASSKLPNSLHKGSSLSVEDNSHFLTSPDKTFTCGFYPVGTNAYSFSIWFTNSADKTVVWMANRDQPVNGRGSKLELRLDGTMALTDVDETVVWSTNTTKTSVNQAELLHTGNLVLKDPRGNILWQSFDSPTDTLLPSQPITKNKKLISAKGIATYSTGYFSFFYNENNILILLYDGPEIANAYWPNPNLKEFDNGRTNYMSSRTGVLDEMGRFISSDRVEFNASDMGVEIKRRLTMDYDGNLRLYSLKSSGLWQVSWQALQQQCSVRGLCGRNGICVYTPKRMCSCPPGYGMNDQSDWYKGCKPKFNGTCNQQVKFVELPQTDFIGFDLVFIPATSFEHCRKMCMGNCSCKAFSYKLTGSGQCHLKGHLFSGYQSPSFPGSMYIKLPKNMETSETIVLQGSSPICNLSGVEVQIGPSAMYSIGPMPKWAYLYGFTLAAGVIEILFLASGWWFLYMRQGLPTSVMDGYRAISSHFRKFPYSELKKATKKFKEEVGKGASGAVYKGVLEDNRVIAVKKLSDVIQGEEEFWAEVRTIGRINHMNLVRMWGFCSERTRKLLVYEYLENGSLDKHLFSGVSSSSDSNNNGLGGLLGWKERFKIALGAAKGLAYLHHECLEWIIHCDVKPENILLDFEFEPKIADFGLSKLSQRGQSRYEFSCIRGTKGYMAPEWGLNLPITAKVDVYSFGIVLLEIAKGIRLSNWMMQNGEEETELTRFLRQMKRKFEYGEGSWIEDMVDTRLNGNFSRKQAAMMVMVGLSCIEQEKFKRPTMDSVVQSLLYVEDEKEYLVDAEEMM